MEERKEEGAWRGMARFGFERRGGGLKERRGGLKERCCSCFPRGEVEEDFQPCKRVFQGVRRKRNER